MSSADPASLWEQLRRAALVEGAAPVETPIDTPWYIRTMLGVAGWIGAIFLLAFVGAAFSVVMKSAASAVFVGALLCAGAVALYRFRPKGDFINQFAFAVSLAGQALVCIGLGQLLSSQIAVIALPIVVLEVALFLLIPTLLHRVWSVMIGAGALVVALGDLGFYPYTEAMVLAAFSWAWLHEFRFAGRGAAIRAFGNGLALLLIAELITRNSTGLWHWVRGSRGGIASIGGEFAFWIDAALIGAVAIWVAWHMMGRYGVTLAEGKGRAAIGGALLIAVVSLKAPGVGVTVVMLLLGFAHGNRVLTGLGIAGLLIYLSHYYYLLQITLLQKSAVLLCAGVALIAARLAMQRGWAISEGEKKDA